MLPFLAVPPVRTEACEVERAKLGADVLLRASRPERTAALVIVRARRELGLGVDVQVKAVRAIRAVEVAGVEVAFWHAASVQVTAFQSE